VRHLDVDDAVPNYGPVCPERNFSWLERGDAGADTKPPCMERTFDLVAFQDTLGEGGVAVRAQALSDVTAAIHVIDRKVAADSER
jgi:hypothetical protein